MTMMSSTGFQVLKVNSQKLVIGNSEIRPRHSIVRSNLSETDTLYIFPKNPAILPKIVVLAGSFDNRISQIETGWRPESRYKLITRL